MLSRHDDKTSSLPGDAANLGPARSRDELHLASARDKPPLALPPRLKNRLHKPRGTAATTPTHNCRSPLDGATHVNGGVSGMANAGGDCSVNGTVVEQQTRVVVAPPTTNDPTEVRALRLAVSTYRLSDESTPTDHAPSSPFASSPPRPTNGPGPVGTETTPELPKTSSPDAGVSPAATEKWSDTSTAQVSVCVYGAGICLCLRRRYLSVSTAQVSVCVYGAGICLC